MTKKLSFKERQALKRKEVSKQQPTTVKDDIEDVINNAAGELTKVSSKELDRAKAEAAKLTEALLQQKENMDNAKAKIEELSKDKEKYALEIEDLKSATSDGEGYIEVDIDDIELHPDNVGIYNDYVLDEKLMESLANEGVLEYLTLCSGESKKYRSLSGNRRLWHLQQPIVQDRIAEERGGPINKVPAVLLGEVSSEEQALRLVKHNTYREKTQSAKIAEALVLKKAYEAGAQIRIRGGKPLDPTSNLREGSKHERETMTRVSKEVWGVTANTGVKYFDLFNAAQKELKDDWKSHKSIKSLDKGVKMSKVHNEFLGERNSNTPKWNTGISKDDALAFGIRIGLKKHLDSLGLKYKNEEKLICQFLNDYTKDRIKHL
jgi:hypothetical protein